MTVEALYHEALVRLARSATGAGRLEDPGGRATVDNPLCGDRVTMEVRLADGRIAALAHRVRGCILCEASAAVIGRAALGATAAGVGAIHARVAAMLRDGAPCPGDDWADLEAFLPARAAPGRHGCVLLPFDALDEALARAGGWPWRSGTRSGSS